MQLDIIADQQNLSTNTSRKESEEIKKHNYPSMNPRNSVI